MNTEGTNVLTIEVRVIAAAIRSAGHVSSGGGLTERDGALGVFDEE